MPNWQERANSARRRAIELENKEAEAEKVLKNSPHLPSDEDIHRSAIEQLQKLGVDTMLSEINKDTRFWAGLGVASTEHSKEKLIYRLFGEHGYIQEKWQDRYVTKFGHYTEVGPSGVASWGHGGMPFPPSEISKFGFHKENEPRLIGCEYKPFGTLLETVLRHDRTYSGGGYIFDFFNIGVLLSFSTLPGVPGRWTITFGYESDQYPLQVKGARSFLNESLLKTIQELDEGPTLAQLQSEAHTENEKHIARINRSIGQTYEQYHANS